MPGPEMTKWGQHGHLWGFFAVTFASSSTRRIFYRQQLSSLSQVCSISPPVLFIAHRVRTASQLLVDFHRMLLNRAFCDMMKRHSKHETLFAFWTHRVSNRSRHAQQRWQLNYFWSNITLLYLVDIRSLLIVDVFYVIYLVQYLLWQ